MTKTLKSVEDPRVWEGGKYPIAFINVAFEDGTKAYYKAKPDSMAKRWQELANLLGKPSEFTLEDDGRGGQKITDYPGKPQPQQNDGKREWKDNSPSIEAQNALNNAVALVSAFRPSDFDLATPRARDAVIETVEWFAPRLHAITQNLKNGGPARPQAPDPTGDAKSSLPAPVGVAASWEDQEQRIASGGPGTRSYGEGVSGSSPSEPSGGESEVNRKEPPANGSPPDLLPTEEQWAEALGYDITRARALAILVKAGQPLTSSEDITARHLESLVRPFREKAGVR